MRNNDASSFTQSVQNYILPKHHEHSFVLCAGKPALQARLNRQLMHIKCCMGTKNNPDQ